MQLTEKTRGVEGKNTYMPALKTLEKEQEVHSYPLATALPSSPGLTGLPPHGSEKPLVKATVPVPKARPPPTPEEFCSQREQHAPPHPSDYILCSRVSVPFYRLYLDSHSIQIRSAQICYLPSCSFGMKPSVSEPKHEYLRAPTSHHHAQSPSIHLVPT